MGRRIEPEVCIYEVYPHSKNALSVVVGPIPKPGGTKTIQDAIEDFLRRFPMFAHKFSYENVSWPCYEQKDLLIAAFRFKHSDYRIRLPLNQTFFIRKKAVWSQDGFFRDLNASKR